MIASLKKELAAVRASQSESKTLRSKIASLEGENKRLSADNTRLASESKSHSSSHSEAQNEIKSLNAKLSTTQIKLQAAEIAAASTAATVAATAKVPGSAGKAGQKNAANANAAVNADMAILKLKEELYSDLTGLMIRNVKKIEGEDVFDCLQTGRNGSTYTHEPSLISSNVGSVLSKLQLSISTSPSLQCRQTQMGRQTSRTRSSLTRRCWMRRMIRTLSISCPTI